MTEILEATKTPPPLRTAAAATLGFGRRCSQSQSTRRRRKRIASALQELGFTSCYCSSEVSGKQRQKGRLTEVLEATKTPPPLRTATAAAENERRQIACFPKLQSLETAASIDSEDLDRGTPRRSNGFVFAFSKFPEHSGK